ncbi:MAG: winged helix-turn-helix domain-containing protein [Gammaproteobacteria bacterium]|nr:winged helix-turn-helix domain-containing protein [Gammaproteobacteria bacterium]
MDPSTCQISQGEEIVKLEPKVMDLLVCMAEHPGEVLSRDELLDDVWQGTVVGYEALTNAVIKLRKAFGDDARHPSIIETYPKKGYRLIAEVETTQTDRIDPSPLPERQSENLRSRPATLWYLLLITTALLIAAIVGWQINEAKETWPPPGKTVMAVLPFVNTGNEIEHSYFSDGITDDLNNRLSGLPGLIVISSNSTRVYKGKAVDVRQVAAELGAEYLLEGSVRRGGTRIRVNAQLIDGKTGTQEWADNYDGELKDVFDLQDQISGQIISALSLKLGDGEVVKKARPETTSTAAYEALLKGLEQTRHFTRESFATAEAHFLQALEHDPGYARAHAALALIYWRAWQQKWHLNSGSRFAGWGRAKQELDAAMEQPTPLALSLHSSMFLYNRRYEQAIEEARKAIALNPSSATGYLALADALAFDGQPVQAIETADNAIRLDPNFTAPYLKIKGRAQFDLQQYDQAIETLERSVVGNPDDLDSMVVLLAAYGQSGQQSPAQEILERLNRKYRQERKSGFTQDSPKTRWPYRNRTDRVRLIEGLRLAGVPEW